MKIRWRRWLLLGGLALGTAAWLKRSLCRSSSPSTNEFLNERYIGAFLVRRRIDPERVEVISEAVSATISEDDSSPLLGPEGATTASLFLNRDPTDPELVWYVELPQSVIADWDDAEATVSAAFPFEHDTLSDTDDTVERELLVHAVNPRRPQTDVSGGVTPQRVADSGNKRRVEVALVSVWFTSGVPERLADRFAGLARQFKAGELELGPIEKWSTEMIDLENMYTESIFLERSVNGYKLLIYMEADGMQQVYEAYYDTWNPVARVSEIVLSWALRDSSPILDYPLKTDYELLAHAVAPNRPQRVADLSNHQA